MSKLSFDLYQSLLKQEQEFGLIKVNQIRYLFILAISFPILSNAFAIADTFLPNITVLLSYIAVTIIHSIVIFKFRNSFISSSFNYFTILFDFILVLLISLYYWRSEYPDNFAFLLKNSILNYFMVPIALSSIEFKIKPLLFAISLAVVFYLSLVFYGIYDGMHITDSWKEYVTGDGFILGDAPTRPMLFILVGGSMIYASIRVRNLLSKSIDSELKRATLARYFSPSVVTELTDLQSDSNSNDIFNNNRKYAVILFSDIRQFTALSEKMDTDELAKFLAEYRSLMLDCIFKVGGTLDKFVGDAVMAVFGIPKSRGNNKECEAAVECALLMQKKLENFNSFRLANGKPAIDIGIGLHAGIVFSGNVESSGQMEYTVLGDAVNVASRLESLTKEYKKSIILSEEVESKLTNLFHRKFLGEVQIRGREQALKIYSLEID